MRWGSLLSQDSKQGTLSRCRVPGITDAGNTHSLYGEAAAKQRNTDDVITTSFGYVNEDLHTAAVGSADGPEIVPQL